LRAAGFALFPHRRDEGGDRAHFEQRAIGAGGGGLVGAETIPQRADDRPAHRRTGLGVQFEIRYRGGGEFQMVGGEGHQNLPTSNK
jgi:hypothetical protein